MIHDDLSLVAMMIPKLECYRILLILASETNLVLDKNQLVGIVLKRKLNQVLHLDVTCLFKEEIGRLFITQAAQIDFGTWKLGLIIHQWIGRSYD